MKSRAIALGASVIALTLAGGGQALAGNLERLGGSLEAQTETTVSTPTGISAELEGKVQVPVKVPSKSSLGDVTRLPARPNVTVEAEQRRGKDSSEVVLDANRGGVSAYADQRRKGELEVEAEGQAGPRGAESEVTGFARGAGKAKAESRARSPKVNAAGIERSVRKHSRPVTRSGALTDWAEEAKPESPLEALGRQVAHPVRFILGGWLIALAAMGGFAGSRLVRRLVRTS